MPENNQTDRRTKMTKMILRQSLIENMKEVPLRKISIKKICDDADINRSTFYRYYESAYDIYNEILDEISAEIVSKFDPVGFTSGKSIKILTEVFEYIENNRETMLVILGHNGGINIGEQFAQIIDKTIAGGSGELMKYCTQFVSAGLLHIVWIWLNEDEPKDAHTLAVVVNTIMMHGFTTAITMSKKQEKGN